MSNNLKRMEKDLRALAKRCKDVKYTKALLLSFLLMGMLTFSEGLTSPEVKSTENAINQTRKELNTSIKDLHTAFKQAKRENNRLLKSANLELIQLMEQGDQVVKSPWSSWQFGMNYFYSNWRGVYKGRGDKKEKYPYEGIFKRSEDVYERYISLDSSQYSLLSKSTNPYAASSNARSGLKSAYGIASTTPIVEPIVGFEVSAGIRPRSVNKSAITIASKTAVTPNLPTAISFTPPKPIINIPQLPDLPAPPTFNIQLGSYCNNMTDCGVGTEGRAYNADYQKYAVSIVNGAITGPLIDGRPSLRHSWSSTGSVLLKSYFDTNSSYTLNENLTVDSTNPVAADTSLQAYNRQDFLVGGSRVATMDNALKDTDATLTNTGTINLVGPLTVGFEVQTDTLSQGTGSKREVVNAGKITDEAETTLSQVGSLKKGDYVPIELAPLLGGNSIRVRRTAAGHTGYKVGLILTFEDNDVRANSKYVLTNNGTIDFSGEKSIGIQIFSPGSASLVEVSNTSNMKMGGAESYGLKWSSRVANNSTMDNSGTIDISGDAGNNNSLSSGIAVIENASYTGAIAIRAYTDKVTNSGTINVSGGKGNTGMVLVVNAADNITNKSGATIKVTSAANKQNIGMRVDLGGAATDVAGTPLAINKGDIKLAGDSSLGLVSTKADATNDTTGQIVTDGSIVNGIGMATKGGKIVNKNKIELLGSGNSNNIGVYLTKSADNTSPTGVIEQTSSIKATGHGSTGILITNGSLTYAGSTVVEGNGVSGIIVGDNGTNTASITATGAGTGTVTVNNGSGVAADVHNSKGSYGIVVGKGSSLVHDKLDVDVNVTSNKSIGLFAGENATLTLNNHTIKADNGAVNYDADNGSTITLKGTGTAVTGKKSLLFYLGTLGTGKILLNGNMTANIKGGSNPTERGNAFYYVGNGYSAFGIPEITGWAANNFGGTLANLTLDMEAGSRLFIAQDVGMKLSETTGTAVSGATGATINALGNYKTFMLYLSKLTIDQDVNLDNSADDYNNLEISNSSIENSNTKTITGTQANQVAMAQENDNTLYSRNKVTLKNKGTINLSGTGSTGMYAKFGELNNDTTGEIIIGDGSTAIYGTNDSLLTNAGKITIGSNSTGMYSEGSTTQGLVNAGEIQTTGSDSVAMSYKPDGGLAPVAVLENTGKITMTGDKNTAIYATGTPGYSAKNSGTITLGDSVTLNNPNVGIYTDHQSVGIENTGTITSGANTIGIYGYGATNSGDLNIGNAGIGIYSQSGNVNLTGGTIKTGTDEAVGVYTVGSGQSIVNTGGTFDMGDNSFGFVNVGTGNSVNSSVSSVSLKNNNVYIYSNDNTGTVTNSTAITSTGTENYGIYARGTVTNNGNIDLSSGIGSVAIYSVGGGTATNNATITVGASDTANSKYSLGMAAGYSTTDTGNIINGGTIHVNGKSGIGMYASGAGSTATNTSNIKLNADNTTGIYADEGAVVNNSGNITTGSGTYSNVVGVYLGTGARLNNTGTIDINASNGIGVYLKGGVIANYGTIKVNGETDSSKTVYEFSTPPTGKGVGGVSIDAPAGAQSAIITLNGVPQTPTIVNAFNVNPKSISASSIGIYINTSGVDYTKPIEGLSKLTGEADLIVGSEATKITNSKYILVNDPNILNPYKAAMTGSKVKWNIYSGSLTWISTPTLDPSDGTITNIYMAKVPYTNWAGKEPTPVEKTDTYNFLNGLEQRYDMNALDSREKLLFNKLNGIGNNEETLFYQAIDEMMGHQYANVQQRINRTGVLLDKEFSHLKKEWDNKSKQSNKIKAFGMRDEYKTNTAGIIDYTSNAYGVAYVHEDETIKLGNSTGWYAGAVHNRLRFKDIGRSKEDTTMLKMGIFKSKAFDHNNSLNWTISGEGYVSRSDMHRKFLVVDEIFNAKSSYYTYGAALKNEISKNSEQVKERV